MLDAENPSNTPLVPHPMLQQRNRDMPATAGTMEAGGATIIWPGLTKREHAAIAIAASLATSTRDMRAVAQLAVLGADALFDELEKPR